MQEERSVFIEEKNSSWEDMGGGVKRQIVSHDEKLMMVKVEFEKGAIGSLHQHPHVQMSYVEKGKFEVEIGGSKKTLSAGDSFYVPSNLAHGVVCIEDGVLIDVFSPMREDFLKK